MADFTFNPSYTYEEEIGFRNQMISMENGAIVSNSRGTPRRAFTLTFLQIDQTTHDNIVTFYKARTGQLDSFNWVNPNDSVTYDVRFVNSSLESSETDYQIYDLRCQLLEVI